MNPSAPSSISHHLVQANVARGHAPLTDPIMKDFVDLLDYINSVADRAPGFVWRYQTDDGDATGVRVLGDPLVIFNMSVWESIEALYQYAFKSEHTIPLKRRREWFTKMDKPYSVMWWVPAGELPTVDQAEAKLAYLDEHGPSPAAFTFASLFDAQGQPTQGGPRGMKEAPC